MTVRIRSALEHLVDTVRAYLVVAGVDAEVAFGKRALAEQINQGPGGANRIVFVPFDPKSGDAGTLDEPSQVGPREITRGTGDAAVKVGTVRALADWKRKLVVSIWAYDRARPEDELAQESALERLVEATVQAVHFTGFASVTWAATNAVLQGERRFGRENVFALELVHPLFDRPNDVGYPAPVVTKHMRDG